MFTYYHPNYAFLLPSSIRQTKTYVACHSHKKCLEGSMVRVLFAAELEFPKIPVPRLLKNTLNANIESTGKSIKATVLFM